MTEEQRLRALRRFDEIASKSTGPTMADIKEMSELAELMARYMDVPMKTAKRETPSVLEGILDGLV